MKRKIKIIMLSQAAFPPDIRLEKEIKSLSKAGYKIMVVCNQYNKSLNPKFEFCEIRRVRAIFNSIKMNRIINFPVIFNIRFIVIILKNIFQFKPNFIHAHDLPMMPFAILIKWILRIPVVFDMHENYPAALKFFNKKGIINFIFKNPQAAVVLEKFCLKWSDKIIVVIEENNNRLLNLGVNENKIRVVSNTVELESLEYFGQKDKNLVVEDAELAEKKILLYTGRVSTDRGLETAVLAMNNLKTKILDVVLVIVGDGEYINTLEEIASKKRLTEFIKLIKWPGQENLQRYFNVASICIIPQPGNDFIDTTIPHKLFEYMLQAKPVLTSNALPLKRILDETSCGLYFKSNDPEDFAAKVLEILSSNIPFGENGLRAVKQTYNWEKDSQVLIKLYQDFESK